MVTNERGKAGVAASGDAARRSACATSLTYGLEDWHDGDTGQPAPGAKINFAFALISMGRRALLM